MYANHTEHYIADLPAQYFGVQQIPQPHFLPMTDVLWYICSSQAMQAQKMLGSAPGAEHVPALAWFMSA